MLSQLLRHLGKNPLTGTSQSKRRNGFKTPTIGEATPKVATFRRPTSFKFKTQTEISNRTLSKCRSTKSRRKICVDKFRRRPAKSRRPPTIQTQIIHFRQNRQVKKLLFLLLRTNYFSRLLSFLLAFTIIYFPNYHLLYIFLNYLVLVVTINILLKLWQLIFKNVTV